GQGRTAAPCARSRLRAGLARGARTARARRCPPACSTRNPTHSPSPKEKPPGLPGPLTSAPFPCVCALAWRTCPTSAPCSTAARALRVGRPSAHAGGVRLIKTATGRRCSGLDARVAGARVGNRLAQCLVRHGPLGLDEPRAVLLQPRGLRLQHADELLDAYLQ